MKDHEKNVKRIESRLQLVAAPLAEPDRLTVHINIAHRKAAIYCDISATPEKVHTLVDAKADKIAEWLDEWGID